MEVENDGAYVESLQVASSVKYTINTNNLQEYFKMCKVFHVRNPDYNIIQVLSHPHLNTLEVGSDFDRKNLLCLETLFIDFKLYSQIKKIVFRKCNIGDQGCPSLHNIISHRLCDLEELVLDTTGITYKGMRILSPAIGRSRTLNTLNLSGNGIGVEGCRILSRNLSKNHTLEVLDIRNCGCGYEGICSLQEIHQRRKKTINNKQKKKLFKIIGEDSNYFMEEIFNSATHGLAFLLFVVPATSALVRKANVYESETMFYSYLVYSTSLSLLYLSSCLLHAFFSLERTSEVFQIFDHCSISLLISGTYTPIVMNSFGHTNFGIGLGITIWVLCFVTFYISVKKPGHWSELVLYVLMGVAILMCFPFIWHLFPKRGWVLMIIGGASYLTGILFYLWGRVVPMYHVIWHLFVILGSVSHFFAIYHYDVPHGENLLFSYKDTLMKFFTGE